jgi:probable HAF family extracellular repeat protein
MRATRTTIGLATVVASVLPSLIAVTPAAAAENDGVRQYQAIDLGTLEGGPNSYPTAVNDHQEVVGSSQVGTTRFSHAFLWRKGELIDLGVLNPDFPVSYAYDINNRGQIVGTSAAVTGGFHAVLWQDEVMTDLGTLGGASSSATSINERGQAVGRSETDNGETHAFLWQNGVMTDLGIGSVDSSTQLSINFFGDVTGGKWFGNDLHAFRWRRGTLTDLGSLDNFSYANAINDSGTVVGFTRIPSGWGHAFIWHCGVMEDLGILGGGTGYSSAVSINAWGQVVGNSDLPTGGESHPVMWIHDAIIDLTTRGVSSNTVVYGINNLKNLIGARPVTVGGGPQAVLYVAAHSET